ncbi:unnamed protein product [Clonostachys chloroleuca]|uniref:Uncharacterized protein n=1 Tax=Clonostachys chloroleuca TaxID=1926264 RepID=A0AA35MHP5_9HYPO|nr:unnamed protein product [Clonostachys chloroleuca]
MGIDPRVCPESTPIHVDSHKTSEVYSPKEAGTILAQYAYKIPSLRVVELLSYEATMLVNAIQIGLFATKRFSREPIENHEQFHEQQYQEQQYQEQASAPA